MAPADLKAFIMDVPDFPKPGIVFKDITPLLAAPAALAATIDELALHARPLDVRGVLAIESRGFVFGGLLARQLGVPLQLVRKRGKLPRETVAVRYALEYGFDHLEMHVDAVERGERYLIVDDVIATGGTAAATAELIEQQGGIVAACAFVIELDFLRGREQLGTRPVFSLLHY